MMLGWKHLKAQTILGLAKGQQAGIGCEYDIRMSMSNYNFKVKTTQDSRTVACQMQSTLQNNHCL